jgi:hypothetical protein
MPRSDRCRPGARPGRIVPVVAVVPWRTVTGIAFSIVGASYAHHLVHTHHWSHLLDTVIVEGANFVSFAVFWVLKLMIFNRIFKVEEIGEDAA